LKLSDQRKFNYILLKMVYDNCGERRKAVTADDWNVKVLVGEYKILLDKNEMNVKLTPEELEEHRKMVRKWEEDLYET